MVGAGAGRADRRRAAGRGRRARARAGQGRRRHAPRRRARSTCSATRPSGSSSPREALGALVDARPDHPYALRRRRRRRARRVDWFERAHRRRPARPATPTRAGWSENLLLPTAVGVAAARRRSCPRRWPRGDLRRDGADRASSASARCKDFHPALLADNARARGRARRAAVELDLVPEGRADVNALGFARAFDDPAFRGRGRRRSWPAGSAPSERVGVPGRARASRDPHGVWTRARAPARAAACSRSRRCRRRCPGMRVFAILREALRRAGGRVDPQRRRHRRRARRRPRDARCASRVGLREERHGADWVVLATGGFASGGLELDSRWRRARPRSGCRVAGVPEPGEPRFAPGLLRRRSRWRARAWRSTASCARSTPTGARVLENVLVAGATLAGAEPWRRSRATASAWPPATARRSSIAGRRRRRRRRVERPLMAVHEHRRARRL